MKLFYIHICIVISAYTLRRMENMYVTIPALIYVMTALLSVIFVLHHGTLDTVVLTVVLTSPQTQRNSYIGVCHPPYCSVRWRSWGPICKAYITQWWTQRRYFLKFCSRMIAINNTKQRLLYLQISIHETYGNNKNNKNLISHFLIVYFA